MHNKHRNQNADAISQKIYANTDCTAAYADCSAGTSAALRSIGLPANMAFVERIWWTKNNMDCGEISVCQ